ncbi:GIY-YIG nuclease family protein [Flavobacterium sp. '19STA2R22 D10 B1']|uniref:GIY-YIG nuclease family protein n=1 Tax=Flavobacterium aerium TaxID=3037261 RepID=UPI00278C7522|nr:GIY-YIG nuclease family protein [Flavobacterium sp. '19STA2R22 D10 B1']
MFRKDHKQSSTRNSGALLFYVPMEYYMYIIYSKTKNRYYIGSTANLVERLVKHNQNHKGFTGINSDWELVYSGNYGTKEEAY